MSESSPAGEPSSDSDGEDKDSSVCPTCGRDDLTSWLGVKQHHAEAHGESLSKVTFECENCGEKETKYESNTNKRFCSQSCSHEGRTGERLGSKYAELNDREWLYNQYVEQGKTLSEIADIVGCYAERVEQWLRRYGIDRGPDVLGLDLSGENHPMWAGGGSGYYGENWPKQRRKARERDNYTCQACYQTQEELDDKLHVHHIQPIRTFDNPKDANVLLNLVTLCAGCHSKWEGLYLRPDPRGE